MKFIYFIYCILFLPTSVLSGQNLHFYDRGLSCPDETVHWSTDELYKNNDNRRYLYQDSRDTILHFYCQAIAQGDEYLEALTLLRLGGLSSEFFTSASQMSRELGFIKESLEISERNGYTELSLWAYSKFCSIFTGARMYNQAETSAKAFLSLAQKSGDENYTTEGLMMLGRLYREVGGYERADSVLQLAISTFNTNTEGTIKAFTYLHLANLRHLQGLPDEAYEYVLEGMKITNTLAENKGMLTVFFMKEIVESLVHKGRYEEAFQSLEETWERGYYSDSMYQLSYNYSLALVLAASGSTEEAIKTWIKTLRLSEKLGQSAFSLTLADSLFSNLIGQGDLTERTSKFCYIFTNSYHELTKESGMDDLFQETYYRLEEDKSKSVALELRVSNARKISYLTILGALITLIFIILLHKFYRAKSKNAKQAKELNSKLIVLNKQLKSSNNKLESFAHIAAHDLKSPLIYFAQNINVLRKSLASGSKKDFFEGIVTVNNSISSLGHTIDHLLGNSILDSNLPQATEIDLNEIIREAIIILKASHREELFSINIIRNIPPLIGHETIFTRLVINILENAVKFSKEESFNPISIDYQQGKEGFVTIFIKDQGIGIASDKTSDALAIFKQVHDNEDKYKGYGLGLNICKKIVESYGGEIWIDSTLGQGTTVFFSLPLFYATSKQRNVI